ncbi:hypothetical protein HDU98_010912 [Podochytrium sp. JEL0797]|nr:hypothetical protein HDU98_010912 [Podochytrium sp. JEL0797]
MTPVEPLHSIPLSSASQKARVVAVALDSTPFSHFAFKWAIENYIRSDDFVVLLTVQQNPTGTKNLDALVSAGMISQSNKNEAQALLIHQGQQLDARQIAYQTVPVVASNVKETLVQKVEEMNAAALILGSRGASISRSLFSGSVSAYCAKHAPCPILIVKATKTEKQGMKPLKPENGFEFLGNDYLRSRYYF